jgi:hypothetical protein
MKISLKKTLIFSFAILISLSILLIITISYYSTKNIMEEHAKEIMNNISLFALDKSKTYIKVAKEAAYLTQRLQLTDVVNSGNSANMEKYFYEQLSLHQQFAAIYYANTKGEFIMVVNKQDRYVTKIININQDNERKVTIKQNDENMKFLSSKIDEDDIYNPTIRPWYKLAVKNKKLSWTDPYVFFTLKTPGITTSVPVYDKSGELKGVIGVDIKIYL